MKRALTSLWLLLASWAAAGAAPAVDYARDILPILSDKCYHCHGPDENAREAKLRLDTREGALRTNDPIILPGKSSDSELISRITTRDEDDLMPPPDSNRKLTAKEIELLRLWIDQGAKWGQHWALMKPVKATVPHITGSKTATGNPIDAFILARLRNEGLAPAAWATRERWLRRVTFDLTGLPPTGRELDDFLADPSTAAREKVVNRLLASPRFGERMATEWLDLARFADTHGYQMDRYRPAWAYRDWVIKAFNQNLSFDQFMTWQVAGDLLPNPTRDQRLATAFNRLHNQNEEGGIVEEEFRVAYVVDRVNTFSTAFLGLTTECARCHDHKYDPISQRDFYSLFAFFQNIDESGQTTYFTDSTPVPTLLLSTDEQERKLAELKARIAEKEAALVAAGKAARPAFEKWKGEARPGLSTLVAATLTNGLVGHFSFDEMFSNRVANLAGTNTARAQEGPKLVAGKSGQAVELNGENGFTFGKIGHFHRAQPFTLALWLQTPARAPRFTVLHHSKAPVDAGSRGYELLLEEGQMAFGLHHMWPGNALKVLSRPTLPTNQWVHVAVTYDGSSRAQGVKLFINGEAVEHDVVRDNLWKDVTYEGSEPELALGYRFRDNGFKGGRVDELKIFSRALASLEVAALTGRDVLASADDVQLHNYFVVHHHAASRELARELRAARDAQREFINPIPEIMAMEELPQPKPAHVLKRGAYDAPGDRVSPNTPAALLPFPAGQPTNRLGLARWLLQPDHPLFGRVTVNRLWQMMFERGLVETSDNLGSQGAQPTHPELLDWLALDFAEHGWDVKRFLKQIALSETYGRSSQASADALAKDARNELLSRAPARRLSAEMLRDSALAQSGLLVEQFGGPSVKPYQPEGLWDIAMGKPSYGQGQGPDLYRRSLYTYWKRTVPPPTMITFDAADRSYCTARRQNTSTPLQALALLNDIQQVEAARLLGQRMLKEGGGSTKDRVGWLFRTLAGRTASPREQTILARLFDEQLELFTSDPQAANKLLAVGATKCDGSLVPPELAAGTIVANALLNHDEVIMRR